MCMCTCLLFICTFAYSYPSIVCAQKYVVSQWAILFHFDSILRQWHTSINIGFWYTTWLSRFIWKLILTTKAFAVIEIYFAVDAFGVMVKCRASIERGGVWSGVEDTLDLVKGFELVYSNEDVPPFQMASNLLYILNLHHLHFQCLIVMS